MFCRAELFASHRGALSGVQSMLNRSQFSANVPWYVDSIINDEPGHPLLLMLAEYSRLLRVELITEGLKAATNNLDGSADSLRVIFRKADADVVGVPCVCSVATVHESLNPCIKYKIHKVAESGAGWCPLREPAFPCCQAGQ